MKKLLIATKNPGKFGEIVGALEGLPFEFVFLGNLPQGEHEVDESGETFHENALLKARAFANLTKMMTLGEDSGILVEAFPGEFGVRTRRWGAGEGATDEEWIAHFMNEMQAHENRDAKFVCNAVLIDGESCEVFEGETRGRITDELMAEILPGLPLSSCFMPEGFERVYAALTREEKNEISHRGQAISKVRAYLQSRL